jgi:hypothetical protein
LPQALAVKGGRSIALQRLTCSFAFRDFADLPKRALCAFVALPRLRGQGRIAVASEEAEMSVFDDYLVDRKLVPLLNALRTDLDIAAAGTGEVTFTRDQTIMQGAPSCTFRYKFAPR